MSDHSPKLQALLAYDVDALSTDGRARIEAHLDGCEVCRRELATMRLYDELSAEVRAAEVPRLDYSRMELALRREARDQAQSGKGLGLGLLALAAAVLLGVLGLQRRGTSEPMANLPVHQPAVASSTPDVQPSMPTPEQTLEGAITATADARVGGELASLDTRLHEGDVLETGPQGTLHGRLALGTGFALAAASKVTLQRVRPSGVVLNLDHGSVSSAVETGTRYRVDAGSYRVVVRGTRFSVRREGAHVHVSLAQGTVAVEAAPTSVDEADAGEARARTLEVLHAPAEWDSSGMDAADTVALPVAVDTDDSWPGVTLPPFPRVEAWELSGTRFSAADELALRAPVGPLTLQAIDAHDRARELQLEVLPEGLQLTEAMLPHVASEPSQGELHPAIIRAVVRARQPALRRCYERVLRQRGDPSLTRAAYALRVDVGVHGDVRRVTLTASGGEAHEALSDCITHEVRAWTFPAPRGGPVSFSLPLNLSAR